MNAALSRRRFLTVAGSCYCLATRGAQAQVPAAKVPKRAGTLDIHVHLLGVGDGGSRCRMDPAITDTTPFRTLKQLLGIPQKGETLDAGYERVLVQHVTASTLAKAAILGQDAVYDGRGAVDWPQTSFFVPNDYVFDVVSRHPETMIACPSINPDRADALNELNRCQQKGARLFKIHPPTQGVDVALPKHKKFFRLASDLKLTVLVHTGHEHSAPVIDKTLAGPNKLRLALDEGCTVVACHSGTGWQTDSPDQLPQFLELLPKYPNLYGDTAVLGTPGRVRDFDRLLKDPLAIERLLHGSDFPFPVMPEAFVNQIGPAAVKRIGGELNWLTKDLELKEALNVGYKSSQRAHRLLAL